MSDRDMRPYIIPLPELREWIDAIEEQLGDIISQHRAECAAFGDSWPGAQIQIEDMERELQRLNDAMTWRLNS